MNKFYKMLYEIICCNRLFLKFRKHRILKYKITARNVQYWFQRRIRGWDDSELWSLDYTIVDFILPRLKRFKVITTSYPLNFPMQGVLGKSTITSMHEWHIVLDKIIASFEEYKKSDYSDNLDIDKFNEGFDLFKEYFHNLWD